MAAILNSAMLDWDTALLDSDTLLSSLRLTQKHSHSTLTLTQTYSIWLKLIHSHLTWWWQPSLIWPSCILPSYYFLSNSITLAKIGSHHLHKKTSLIHSDSTWWWQPSWILSCWIKKLPSWILTYFYLLSDILKNALTPLWLWLKLIQSDWNLFILINLMMAAILNSAMLNFAILDSAILVFPLKLSHTCQDWFPPFAQKNFTHSFWLNLMMAAILNSAMLDSDTTILDSDTLLSSLRFTEKHSHSTLTLTQTNSIWLKLIHSHWTWWWQPSWILSSWIWPIWIQPS